MSRLSGQLCLALAAAFAPLALALATEGTYYAVTEVANINPDGDGFGLVFLGVADPEFTIVGESLFFRAIGPNGEELYQSDGTSAQLVADINPGPSSSSPFRLTEFQGELYFAAEGPDGLGLYKSDGREVNALAGEFQIDHSLRFQAAGEHLFFTGVGQHGDELFSTDGQLVHGLDIDPFSRSLTPFQDSLVFAANVPTGNGLFQTNGESVSAFAGFDPILNLSIGCCANYAGELYFTTRRFGKTTLYRSDGVSQSVVGDYTAENMTVYQDQLFFADGEVDGPTLLRFDGTTVTELDSSKLGGDNASVIEMQVAGGRLYITVYDSDYRLFSSDGNTVTNLNVSPSYIRGSAEFGKYLYLLADKTDGRTTLLRTDGGDVEEVVIDPPGAISDVTLVTGLTTFNNELFFIAAIAAEPSVYGGFHWDRFGVYRTDGLETSEVAIVDRSGPHGVPFLPSHYFTEFKNELFFIAFGPHGLELFKVTAVPEPSALLLTAVALAGTLLGAARRCRM